MKGTFARRQSRSSSRLRRCSGRALRSAPSCCSKSKTRNISFVSSGARVRIAASSPWKFACPPTSMKHNSPSRIAERAGSSWVGPLLHLQPGKRICASVLPLHDQRNLVWLQRNLVWLFLRQLRQAASGRGQFCLLRHANPPTARTVVSGVCTMIIRPGHQGQIGNWTVTADTFAMVICAAHLGLNGTQCRLCGQDAQGGG